MQGFKLELEAGRSLATIRCLFWSFCHLSEEEKVQRKNEPHMRAKSREKS